MFRLITLLPSVYGVEGAKGHGKTAMIFHDALEFLKERPDFRVVSNIPVKLSSIGNAYGEALASRWLRMSEPFPGKDHPFWKFGGKIEDARTNKIALIDSEDIESGAIEYEGDWALCRHGFEKVVIIIDEANMFFNFPGGQIPKPLGAVFDSVRHRDVYVILLVPSLQDMPRGVRDSIGEAYRVVDLALEKKRFLRFKPAEKVVKQICRRYYIKEYGFRVLRFKKRILDMYDSQRGVIGMNSGGGDYESKEAEKKRSAAKLHFFLTMAGAGWLLWYLLANFFSVAGVFSKDAPNEVAQERVEDVRADRRGERVERRVVVDERWPIVGGVGSLKIYSVGNMYVAEEFPGSPFGRLVVASDDGWRNSESGEVLKYEMDVN